MLHAKTAVFERKLSIVGSMNVNGRSDGWDSESIALVEGEAIARENEGGSPPASPSRTGSRGRT